MSILQAFFLGIVQGLTEFAPVSSSAHLALVPWYLGWQEPALTFDTTLHLGTLLAVFVYFARDIWNLACAFFASLRERSLRGDPNRALAWWLLLGTLPAAIIGAVFKKQFEALFAEPTYIAVFLLCTAVLLTAAEVLGKRARRFALNWLDALLIGLAQAVAIAPGISRSGATISMGMYRGLTRAAAARFSFLLSLPIILGTGLVQLRELAREPAQADLLTLGVGFLAAAVVGYLTIRYLLRYLQTRTLYPFAAYCAALGVLTLVFARVR